MTIERWLTDSLPTTSVGSLLLVQRSAPHGVAERVLLALDAVRSYLSSHGGDVRLLGVDNGVVRFAFSGSCRSCPSSAVTSSSRVGCGAAAPEIRSVEAVAMQPAGDPLPTHCYRGCAPTVTNPRPGAPHRS